MRGVYEVAAVRAAEDALMSRLPPGALMQRAAWGLATECAVVLGRPYGARVILLVGAGNNGGDALFAGAELARRGARVTALLLNPDRAHAAAEAAFRRAGGRVAEVGADVLAGADLVVDGIVGIGGRGGLTGIAAELADAAHDRLTLAVDLPSGVAADTGAVNSDDGRDGTAVRADITVTFGALKPGLLVGEGAELAGEVRLVDIGLGPHLGAAAAQVLEAADVCALLPSPDGADDKYTRGVLGVAAGSPQYGGAGVLTTGAALVAGAGMVRYAGLAPEAIRARYPEVVVQSDSPPSDLRVQAWAVGPGLGTGDAALRLLTQVLATDVAVVVDADAITLVGEAPELVRGRAAATVLTPHDREFARIADGPGRDRLRSARTAARDLGATVLLKGNSTVVAEPDGTTYINTTGTPWLGTAGSGDVLSGLIGSLLASGLGPGLAAAVGAYLHGVAGQLAAADGPPTSVDILDQVRAAIASISRG